jgi:polysaccharide deacetylase 2 family uncharacterized protein YibQ
MLALAIVAVGGIAGYAALQESGLRTPAREQLPDLPAPVAISPQASSAAGGAASKAPAQSAQSGAKIIKVKPDDQTVTGAIVVRNPTKTVFNERTAHLPVKEMIEQSAFGPLPKRASDGRRPMDAYARPWSGARGARVAIVVGGLAVSQTGTQKAISALPAEVTLAFASGGNSINRWMADARRDGHEILLQLPMEPFDYPQVNPGRDTLLVDAAPAENQDSLHRILAKTTNYTGVMNYLGARFTSETNALSPVMAELSQRGLLYLDDGTSARSLADGLARSAGTPFAAADFVIDADRERGAILKKLDELERTARAQGTAIGTGSAFDITIDAVAGWVAEASKRGIEIVPVSALVEDPER